MFSTITSLFTEAIKKFFDSLCVKYASNIVALFVAVFVGGIGTWLFYVFNNVDMTTTNIICIFLMMGANWIGSMIGYDKIKQAIYQATGGKNDVN
jgi:hypothetical protein